MKSSRAEQPFRRRRDRDIADCIGGDHSLAGRGLSRLHRGLRHDGQLYRFATYTGAAITRLDLADTHATWHMTGRGEPAGTQHRLEIEAWRAEGGLLHSPERVAMQQRVLESLTTRLDVRLLQIENDREQLVFEGSGRHAGLEIVGPISEIQRLAQKKDR